jgi:hypothetical protein
LALTTAKNIFRVAFEIPSYFMMALWRILAPQSLKAALLALPQSKIIMYSFLLGVLLLCETLKNF